MSSMVRTTIASALLLLASGAAPAEAQYAVPVHADGSEWDTAHAALKATPAGTMAMGIARWKQLVASDRFLFADYSGFLVSYPDFPENDKLRAYAERALERETVEPARIVAYFDRVPPLTNGGKAQYALALFALGRPEAPQVGLAAWRGGVMSDAVEANLFPKLGPYLTLADHDARMDALLWASSGIQAGRLLRFTSPEAQPMFAARLSLVNGVDPLASGIPVPAGALNDPGYVYNRAHWLRVSGQAPSAGALLVARGPFAHPALDQRKWVAELLAVARRSDDRTAVRIAGTIDDAFLPGADISRMSYGLRDDYTSLMWLGGTKALWNLQDGKQAAPLFWRYGNAARTPQTRAKGFYWAGRAMAYSGDLDSAARYFEMAAAYPDQFYGLLALERLQRPLPSFADKPQAVPTQAERDAFNAKPLTAAVREVARESDWPTTVRFFKEISEQAETEDDHVLVAQLAAELGRRDLGVILGQSAHADGYGNFRQIAFPQIPVPAGADWTMVHAISRQESQFSQNAISHAGARGLMQLMPGTAREQAGKINRDFVPEALISDPGYNMLLGDAYFQRMLRYYNGSYPLAVAAYNAGPGNVNKWLAANGDPRNGSVDWIDWIERIPLSETRNYVQRVLENAVVYEALYPGRASYRGANPLSHFLGKRNPG
ncbi:lytic transglycosylase domain-containing protein [Novosphingobium sp.]|uniref:lytic transglycosylase domain-containing protein n=1 Tax=Novosphingobium sp. TaxID=1874826 RepID=UPI0035AF7197